MEVGSSCRPSCRNSFSSTIMRGAQKPWAHLCCCDVLSNTPQDQGAHSLFYQCASTSWSRGDSNLVTVEAKILDQSACWRPTSHAQSLLCVLSLCLVGTGNLISKWSSWSMKELSSPKRLCKRQRLAWNAIPTKPERSSPRLMPWRQAS